MFLSFDFAVEDVVNFIDQTGVTELNKPILDADIAGAVAEAFDVFQQYMPSVGADLTCAESAVVLGMCL